jgi:phosphohistidine phosphatase
MKGFEICLFRHGIAVDPSDPSVAGDPTGQSRPLTEEGIHRTRAAAEGLKRLDVGFNAVFTSPWLRARQTAAIVAEILDLQPAVEMPELAGDRSPAELIEAIGRAGVRHPVLVGHEPLLSATVGHLLGVEDLSIEFKKSGACLIQADALPVRRGGTLLWLLTPKQLRRIGKG